MMYDDLKKKLGKNLLTVAEYGVNGVIIVLDKIDMDVMKKLKEVKGTPLVMTKKAIKESLDVFPLEFLNIKLTHNIKHGDKFIDSLKISKKDVRRQLEFELRSKLIHLREGYIGIRKYKDLKEMLQNSVPVLLPLCHGLLFVKGKEVPEDKQETFKAVKKAYKVDMDVMLRIMQQEKEFDSDEIVKELMEMLEDLIEKVDKLK